jgi:hypothetical protein
MKKAKVQYTLRNVPLSVDSFLREKAARQCRSLNEVAIEAMQSGAGIGSQLRYPDLDGFLGSWIEDKETDKALKDQRKIDRELWS